MGWVNHHSFKHDSKLRRESTMRASDYGGKFDAVGKNTKTVASINRGFKKAFNTQKNILPQSATPNKQWLLHTFESGNPAAQVIYARLYA